jgi:hypothetical protein
MTRPAMVTSVIVSPYWPGARAVATDARDCESPVIFTMRIWSPAPKTTGVPPCGGNHSYQTPRPALIYPPVPMVEPTSTRRQARSVSRWTSPGRMPWMCCTLTKSPLVPGPRAAIWSSFSTYSRSPFSPKA